MIFHLSELERKRVNIIQIEYKAANKIIICLNTLVILCKISLKTFNFEVLCDAKKPIFNLLKPFARLTCKLVKRSVFFLDA